MMGNLAAIKKKYLNTLSDIYDKQEIISVFGWICDEVFHKSEILIDDITEEEKDRLLNFLTELQKGKPLQHLLGKCRFYNLDFYVNSDVLIPRPETEELVYYILNNHKQLIINILDVCTGSGCIAVSLKKNISKATVSGLDISEKALEIASKNAELNKADISFIQDDALNLISSAYPVYDIIVSNPPYIKEEEKQLIHRNVLDYEPHLALFVPNENPLIFYDKISDFALTNLKKEGFLYFEINQYLAEETKVLLKNKGYKVKLIRDLNDNFRFVEACF